MTDLGVVARRLLARWWVLTAGVVVGAVAATVFLSVDGRPWVSCAVVEVRPVLAGPVDADAPVRRYVLMDNELAAMEGEEVRVTAQLALGSTLDPDALTVRVPPNSEVLRACYRDPDPDRAVAAADALATAYQVVRRQAVDSSVEAALTAATAAQAEAEEAAARASSAEERAAARELLRQLDERVVDLEALDQDGSRVLSAPSAAAVDTEHVRLVLASGVALGLLAGAVVALTPWRRTGGAAQPEDPPTS